MAKRILIVDDNKPLTRMMTSALETLPYPVKVSSVPSGEEALLSVMIDKPDLLVVDLNLPGMNGLDLIQLLRDRYQDLNIVMATGDNDSTVFRRAEELGVDYRFPKPFETVAFLDAVNRILNGKELNIADLNLPSEPPERMDDSVPELSFSDAVVELHKRLDAISVAVIGDEGRIIVQAGAEVTTVLSEGWELPIMSTLSAVETFQQHLPGQPNAQVLVFQTSDANILLVPVGRHGLLAALPPGKKKLFLKKEIEIVLEIQHRISTFTPPFEAHDPTGGLSADALPEEEAAEEEEIEVQEIDITALLASSAHEMEADSFWNTTVDDEEAPAPPQSKTGYLDFSQAEQLGLTPKDEEG
ncbi:MAG: response regulator [Anaerolineae bacterium]|jgi:two-component system response regulator (stage 0 sporulation protein F)|nr:response regulator [Anaerolineae bacterium]